MPLPNIVLIMTDQQRAAFSKAEGYPLDATPFVDGLGERGVRFAHAYTPMPTCAPARCAMLSGRFPKATRVRENSGIKNIHRTKDLVETLREKGYRIYLSGKNHSYLANESFDRAFEYTHTGLKDPAGKSDDEGRMDEWLKTLRFNESHEAAPFPVECQPPHRVVRDGLRCIESDAERPFFLWLSFAEPHNPYQVSEPYFSLFPEAQVPDRLAGPEAIERRGPKWRWWRKVLENKRPGYDRHWRRMRATYLGMVRLIDDQVRRFVEELRARGRLENTILIVTSDHGDYAGDYGLPRKGLELPEALVRVPLVMAGPGIPARGVNREDFVSLVDLMPTLCEAVGAEIPYGVQGRSLWPMLTGGTYPKAEFRSVYSELGIGGLHYDESDTPKLHFKLEGPTFDCLNCVTQSGNLKMVRLGKWKLVFDMLGHGQLYDLERDPGELENRFDDPALRETRLELAEELLKWTIRTEDPLPGGNYVPKPAERNWYAPHAGKG